jgi:tetrahydromethanopterin S-methyltransferase subunit G
MIKIIKLIDQLRDRLSYDYSIDEDDIENIYKILDDIEKEVRKPNSRF